MAWVFEEEEVSVNEGEQQPKEGWVFEEAQEEPETNYLRAIGGAAKEAVMGGVDIASRMMGGGQESPMAMEEKYQLQKRQTAHDEQAQQLGETGISEEQITEQIGNRPDLLTLSEGVDELTGGALLPQTSTERVFQEGGKTAGEFVAMNAMLPGASTIMGLAKEAGLGALFGTGAQMAQEDGQGEGAQFSQGLLFAMTPWLLSKGKGGMEKAIEWGKRFSKAGELPSGMPKFMTESGTKGAMADLELSSRDLLGRTAKISEASVSKFEDLVGKVSEPAFKDVGTFRSADIESEIIKSNEKAILDKISVGDKTQKKSWEGIQKYVEGNFEALQETYGKLYDTVEAAAKSKSVIPVETHKVASKIYKDLEQSIVRAPEEGGVKQSLQELVNILKPMSEGNLVELPLSQLMAGKRSINRLLKKADINPAPIDLLKPVSAAMKRDTMNALEGTGLKPIYESAENLFAEGQKVYNNDAIRKLRKTQNAEDMSSFFSKPSNIEKLKESVGDNKAVQNFTDRLIVENIAGKSKALANDMANESREYLSKNAQKNMDKILEYGDTLSSPGQQAVARGRILEDIQKAFDTGSRPKQTLDMMQSDIGYKMVKDTLNKSPKGKRMFKSLQRMTFEDMMSSVVGENKAIDFEKTKDILSNPHLKSVVKDALGKEGLNFFQNLEKYGNNMAENLHTLKTKQPSVFNQFLDKYLGSKLKYILFAVSPKMASLGILGGMGVKQAQRLALFQALENPKSRNIMKMLGQKGLSGEQTKSLIKRFGQVAGKSDKDN